VGIVVALLLSALWSEQPTSRLKGS
jgi:hypothetical protein